MFARFIAAVAAMVVVVTASNILVQYPVVADLGPIHLGELQPGMVDEVPTQAMESLLGLPRAPRKAGWAKPKPRPNQHKRRTR